MYLFTIWQLWSKGHCKIQQKSFLGHPIGHAVFVCADSFRYAIYIFIGKRMTTRKNTRKVKAGMIQGGQRRLKKMKIYENWQWVSFEREMECDKLEN